MLVSKSAQFTKILELTQCTIYMIMVGRKGAMKHAKSSLYRCKVNFNHGIKLNVLTYCYTLYGKKYNKLASFYEQKWSGILKRN